MLKASIEAMGCEAPKPKVNSEKVIIYIEITEKKRKTIPLLKVSQKFS